MYHVVFWSGESFAIVIHASTAYIASRVVFCIRADTISISIRIIENEYSCPVPTVEREKNEN